MNRYLRKLLVAGVPLALFAAVVTVAVVAPATGTDSASASVGVIVEKPGKVLPSPEFWGSRFSQRLDIRLLATYDDSGPAAWNAAAHPLVFITTMGPGYGGFNSKNTLPGVALFDGATKKLVASRTYDLGYEVYFEPHGVGASPDGRYLYLPTGDLNKRDKGNAGRILVINAKTLHLRQVISTKSMPHHFKAFTRPDGRQLVMGEDFNWQAPRFGVRPGSGVYVLDPLHDNQVVGGINADTLQANPYLAFANPKGDQIWVGLPPGPISDPDIFHKLDGSWAVVSTKTWEPIKYFKGGFDPIWTAFSPDDKLAYLCDGGADEVFKIDAVALKVLAKSRSSVHGAYGCHLGWSPSELWMIEKGEASHNRGKNIGLVDAQLMVPVDEWNTRWIRADHAMVHPNQDLNELWVSSNSSFEVVVWDMGKKRIKARLSVPLGASTHSGAFVQYQPDFEGTLLSDQNGLHGSALETQKAAWAKASPPKK